MSESKKILPRLEFIIIAVFFIGFLFWAMSRCNASRSELTTEREEDRLADSLMRAANTVEILEKARKDSVAAAQKAEAERIVTEQVTPLYTTVEGVNVRREPKLGAPVVSKLVLHEEVTFLNEITDFKQELTIEGQQFNEPWVKVKTQAGRIGWVYGGTVSYYKK